VLKSRLPTREGVGGIFGAALIALLGVVASCALAVSRYASSSAAVERTAEIRNQIDAWLHLVVEGETGARGYVVTGQDAFLEPYRPARDHERAQALAVRSLVSTGDVGADLASADDASRAVMAHLDELVRLTAAGRQREALNLLASGPGKRLMDGFRRHIADLRADQEALLAHQRAAEDTAALRALGLSVLLVLVSCGLVGVAWQRERRHGVRLRLVIDLASARLRALSELAAALAEARTREQVARVVVDHGMRAAGADTCTLYELDEHGEALDLIADRNVAPEVLERIRRITASSGNPVGFERMKSGAMTWAESKTDYANIYPDIASTESKERRAQAFWSAPLVAEGKSLGLLGVGYFGPRSFPPDERAFIETVAGHCAQALLRAQRLEREDEARQFLATTLRSIGDAVIATDAGGRVTFMNAVAESMTGWAESDARGRPLDEVFVIFSEQTRAPVESPVTKVLREGAIVGLANHTIMRSKRGLEIPIDDSGAPIRAATGEIRGVVMVFRDVADQKRDRARADFLARAGEVLVSSLDYQSILGTIAQFAVPALADWCSVELLEPGAVTPRQVAVAHVDEKKVRLARELAERYPPDYNAETGVPNVIRTGKAELYGEIAPELLERGARDADHLRALRDLRLESALIVPLRVRARTFGALSFIYADSGRRYTADDLVFAEDFARRAAMAIENALALKEAEDARMREQVLRSEAELANRAKDEFLATVSHELRTPLSAILGWTQLLRSRTPSPELDRGLATIERNARLQTKLIEDVLDISRIISGKLVLNTGQVALRDVLASAIDTVMPTAAAKEITIDVVSSEEDVTIVADADRLQQVIWNLLSNAIKFTPAGGRVGVRAQRRGSEVFITVTDTGEGIRRSALPFLFEPFRQADASTTRRHGGLGLGLAIVRQIVTAHGGSVRADSAGEGKGATFTVSLPLRAPIPAFSGPGGAIASTDEIPRLDGLRLLVVDDEHDAIVLLAEALGDRGAKVHTVSSAREALDGLAILSPDLVISDISMPVMDGLALIKEIRTRSPAEGGTVPAIALTAFSRPEDVERALAAGYQTHLSKPVDIGSLSRAAARLAKGSS